MKLPEGKTVRMKAADAVIFLEALRGGKYAQSKFRLYNPEPKDVARTPVPAGYCCLGVLEKCLTGEVETHSDGITAESVPSLSWLHGQGITFYDKWGVVENNPYLPALDRYATLANDSGAYSFAEIADAFEKAIVTY